MKLRPLAALVVCAFPFFSACREKVAWPPQPATVHLGEDTCFTCRMIISDPHFGAQLHFRDGRVELFDDLGCLLQKHAGASLPPESVFLRNFKDGGWVRGDQAGIVRAAEIGSPMGYGLAAFAGSEAADLEAKKFKEAAVYSIEGILQIRLEHPHEQGRGQQ